MKLLNKILCVILINCALAYSDEVALVVADEVITTSQFEEEVENYATVFKDKSLMS